MKFRFILPLILFPALASAQTITPFNTFVTGQPAATTPLAGTELVPIIQGGSTKRVPASSLSTGGTITGVTAGAGLSGGGAAGNVTLNNAGVTNVTAGTGIGTTAATGSITLSNTGVTSLSAGSNITLSGSTGAVTIASTGGGSGSQVAVFTNIAGLRAAGAPSGAVNTALTEGYTAANDGGGGAYTWNASSTTADNGWSVIQATGVSTGRWLLNYNLAVHNLTQFGAKCDGSTDDTTAIQAWLSSAASYTLLSAPAGQCVFSSPLTSSNIAGTLGVSIQGAGPSATVFAYTGAAGGTSDLITIGNSSVNQFVDARIGNFGIEVKNSQSGGAALHVSNPTNVVLSGIDIGILGFGGSGGAGAGPAIGFWLEGGGGTNSLTFFKVASKQDGIRETDNNNGSASIGYFISHGEADGYPFCNAGGSFGTGFNTTGVAIHLTGNVNTTYLSQFNSDCYENSLVVDESLAASSNGQTDIFVDATVTLDGNTNDGIILNSPHGRTFDFHGWVNGGGGCPSSVCTNGNGIDIVSWGDAAGNPWSNAVNLSGVRILTAAYNGVEIVTPNASGVGPWVNIDASSSIAMNGSTPVTGNGWGVKADSAYSRVCATAYPVNNYSGAYSPTITNQCGSSAGAVSSVTSGNTNIVISPTTGAVVATMAASPSFTTVTTSAGGSYNCGTAYYCIGDNGTNELLGDPSRTMLLRTTLQPDSSGAHTIGSSGSPFGNMYSNSFNGGSFSGTTGAFSGAVSVGGAASLNGGGSVTGSFSAHGSINLDNCNAVTSPTLSHPIIEYCSSTGIILGDGSQAIVAESSLLPGLSGSQSIGGVGAYWNTIYATNGTINTSDARLKTNVENETLGLDFVNSLRPVSYDWIANANGTHHGFIAQEVEASLGHTAFAGLHKPENDNDNYGLSYTELIAPLVKSIQELSAANDNLRAEVEELKKNAR